MASESVKITVISYVSGLLYPGVWLIGVPESNPLVDIVKPGGNPAADHVNGAVSRLAVTLNGTE